MDSVHWSKMWGPRWSSRSRDRDRTHNRNRNHDPFFADEALSIETLGYVSLYDTYRLSKAYAIAGLRVGDDALESTGVKAFDVKHQAATPPQCSSTPP